MFTVQGLVSDSESTPHYRSGDEPEPIDLTHLNIEASMMCLASKVGPSLILLEISSPR